MNAPRDEGDGPRPASHATVEIAGYRVQRVLGQGDVATVYAALQTHPRRTVALKVLKPGVASMETMRHFRREVETLGKLQHPNIAQIFDAGTCDQGGVTVPYYVMEYVAGGRNILEHATGRELLQRLRLFVKICSAVDFGHKHKVIHRDLSPANILVDRAGEPKVIDFGIARAVEGAGEYRSPEQLATPPVDIDLRSDVYALGVLLRNMVAGGLDGDLETIIGKATVKERSERYHTVGSLGRDVVRYVSKRPIHARGDSRLYRARLLLRRRRAALIAAAVVVVIGATAAGVVAWERLRPGHEQRLAEETLEAQRQERERLETLIADRAEPTTPQTPAPPIELDAHTARVTALAFDQTGTRLLSGSADETFVLWDLNTETALITARDHDRALRYVAFSPDGELLATAAEDGSVMIVEINGNTVEYSRRDMCPAGAAAVHFGPVTWIALACDDLTLRLWATGASAPRTLRSSSGAFTAVAFDAGGRTLATGTSQGRVELWDVATGRRLRRMSSSFSSDVVEVGFSADGRTVAAVATDGMILRWPLAEDGGSKGWRSGLDHVDSAAIAPGCGLVVCASSDAVLMFDLDTGEALGPPETIDDTITAVVVDADGSRYAIGGTGGRVVVLPVSARR